jgi:hypothetical protein
LHHLNFDGAGSGAAETLRHREPGDADLGAEPLAQAQVVSALSVHGLMLGHQPSDGVPQRLLLGGLRAVVQVHPDAFFMDRASIPASESAPVSALCACAT